MIKLKKLLLESMDVYVKGYKASKRLDDLLSVTQHVSHKFIFPLIDSLPDDQKRYFNKNMGGVQAYDTITPDGDDYDKPTGVINFYIAGLMSKNIKTILIQTIRELKRIGVSVGKLRLEKSNLRWYNGNVIRIPVIDNKNVRDTSGPPELNMSNTNTAHVFKNILMYDAADEYDSIFEMTAQDLLDRVNAILTQDVEWIDKNIRKKKIIKPTENPEDISNDEEDYNSKVMKNLGNGLGATMIDMGLSGDEIKRRLLKLKEIAEWAISHGYKEIYVA